MGDSKPHIKTLEEIERDCIPGLVEVLRTEGVEGVRYALWDMTKQTMESLEASGFEGMIQEGPDAFDGYDGALPCFVHHRDAGGWCERPGVMQVYGISFCEVHGAEVKAGVPGRTPKVDQKTRKMLNEDMKERPAATIAERLRFLEMITGERLSYSTVWRLLKRLGWSRKKIGGRVGARRAAKSRLEGDGRRAG